MFDRLLSPASVTRQSVSLRDGFGGVLGSPVVTYDPVLRTVRIENPSPRGGAWLVPDQLYEIVLGVPSDAGEAFVLRAIDGAPLDLDAGTLRLAFLAKAPSGRAVHTPVEFCRDVYPTFATYCADCHSSSLPAGAAASLVLDTGEGVRGTAVGRVSNEANTGARAAVSGPPSAVFGVDMALVAPGSPGTSWLIYKMLMQDARSSASPACAGYGAPAQLTGPGDVALDPTERARLSDLMTGQPMPPSPSTPSLDEIERVSEWIAQGARIANCAGCTRAMGDAGAD